MILVEVNMGKKRIIAEVNKVGYSANEIEITRPKKKARLTPQKALAIKKRKQVPPNPEFSNKKKLKVHNFEVVEVDDANLLRPSWDESDKPKPLSSKDDKTKKQVLPDAQSTAHEQTDKSLTEVKVIDDGDEIQPSEQKEIDEFCDDIEDERALKKYDVWIRRLDAVLKGIK